jgi:hypothetical protein
VRHLRRVRLIRYLLRPSICTDRLRLLASELIAYDLPEDGVNWTGNYRNKRMPYHSGNNRGNLDDRTEE